MTVDAKAARGTPSEDEKDEKNIEMRLLENRTVMLAREITRESAQRVISRLLLLDAEDAEAPIKLFVNSPGGDVDAGFAIFDVVRYIKAPVEMIVAGLAASAAVIVLVASPGERRFSLPNARFLIHQPSTGVQGVASDIQIEASEILKSREKINKLIAAETGKSVEQIDKDTRRNFWMNAQEAKDYGLVSEIVKQAT